VFVGFITNSLAAIAMWLSGITKYMLEERSRMANAAKRIVATNYATKQQYVRAAKSTIWAQF